MIMVLGRAILKKILGKPEIKTRVIEALRAEAKKSDTKIDDSAVDAVEVIWDVVMPVLLGKL